MDLDSTKCNFVRNSTHLVEASKKYSNSFYINISSSISSNGCKQKIEYQLKLNAFNRRLTTHNILKINKRLVA